MYGHAYGHVFEDTYGHVFEDTYGHVFEDTYGHVFEDTYGLVGGYRIAHACLCTCRHACLYTGGVAARLEHARGVIDQLCAKRAAVV